MKTLGFLEVLTLRAAMEEVSGGGSGDNPQGEETQAYRIELVPSDSIAPYEGNPRRNGKAVDKVARSIEAYGFRQPIVVDADGVIVVGHTRWLAAKRLGLVPVHRAGSLSGEEAWACWFMDNGAHEGSTWDQGLSALEPARPSDDGFDFDLTGFDEEELGRMPAGGDAVDGGDPAGGGQRRARRAGARDGRRSVPAHGQAGQDEGTGDGRGDARSRRPGRTAARAPGGMPVGSLEPRGMVPAAAFFRANSDTFWPASPVG